MPDLTDAEMRAAAAGRPGYATYPQYRPGQRERLGRLPGAGNPSTRTISAATVPTVPAGPAPAHARTWLDARLPLPITLPPFVTLLALPPARVFDFQPRRIEARPWWRPRWHWGVLTAAGGTQLGYAWTEAGARRRTARAARRAAR